MGARTVAWSMESTKEPRMANEKNGTADGTGTFQWGKRYEVEDRKSVV